MRESAAQLVRYAKQTQTALFLVGHVTKEGTLAGPRVLEHMVDTVLYFEGDSGSRYRLIRAIKNRFGANRETVPRGGKSQGNYLSIQGDMFALFMRDTFQWCFMPSADD